MILIVVYLVSVAINAFYLNFLQVNESPIVGRYEWMAMGRSIPNLILLFCPPFSIVVSIVQTLFTFLIESEKYRIVFPYKITWKD